MKKKGTTLISVSLAVISMVSNGSGCSGMTSTVASAETNDDINAIEMITNMRVVPFFFMNCLLLLLYFILIY
jgi:hypothetical protein